MINSVIVGIVVFFLIELEFAFLYNDEEREKIDYVTSQDLLTGVIMGVLVGCINYPHGITCDNFLFYRKECRLYFGVDN